MKDKTVLVIDDEPLIRKTTAILLKKEGVFALEAPGGEEGLAVAARQRPNLILLDIMMPGIDGWEVLRRLKSDPALQGIPVLIFTAIDFTTSEGIARERGAAGILRKPFHLHQLKDAIGLIPEDGGDQ